MSDAPPLPPKKQTALDLLEKSSVFVHLDPRAKDVIVPLQFQNQGQLVLQLGLNMAVNIPDLDVNDDGIGCTLSFNRVPQWCFVPWHAVYGLVGDDGRGMIWPDDVPPEIAAESRRASFKVVGKTDKPRVTSESLPDSVAGDAAPAGRSPVNVVPELLKEEPTAARPQLALAAALVEEVEEPADTPEDGDDDDPGGGSGKELPSYLRIIK
jgi:stringent starvation protein B